MTEVPSTLTRRSLLAGCTTGCAALAGCVGVGSGGCDSGFFLSMVPATEEDFVEETLTEPSRDRPDAWREIVSTAVERGETRYTTIHSPPVRDGDRIEYEGGYYRFSREQRTTEGVEAHVFSAEYDADRDPPSGATVVPFEDFPEADRSALGELLGDPKLRFEGTQGFSIGGYPVVYPDGAEADSRLLGSDSTWVRYDGGAVEVRVEGTEEVERVTYRYTAEELAADREAYLAYVRETFVVGLGDVSEGEREVLSRTIDAGSEDVKFCAPEGAERAVIERFESIPEAKTPRHGTWFVEYEGEVYLTTLSEFVA